MSLSREFHRGERRLWIGPTAITGPEIRAACMLPAFARIGIYAGFCVLIVILSIAMAAAGLPFVAALPIFAVVGIGAVLALQAYAGDRRRRSGMVQVPLTTWDLIVELGKVAPESVLEARRLQDQLVAVTASPGYRDGEVAAIEARMNAGRRRSQRRGLTFPAYRFTRPGEPDVLRFSCGFLAGRLRLARHRRLRHRDHPRTRPVKETTT